MLSSLQSVTDNLHRLVAWLMNRVRVNQIQQSVQDGLPVFVKRRRAGGSIVIWFGNRFLALAQGGIRMFVRAHEWADWEVYCARLLYPHRPAVQVGPGLSVIVPEISGVSLRQLLRQHEAAVNAFVAAARELRRAHQIPCNYYQAAWSHGDLHLDNILYDAAADRAVLIDFDTRHEFRISQTQRHADDLKVLLLELLGLPDERWREPATALIEEYSEPAVLNELAGQLFVPRGFAKILWHTRTNCSRTPHLEQRLQGLRAIIERVVTTHSTGPGTQLCRDAG
ncbi:MAG: phosphotransferase [Planctomycetes bacterium]|nr:phosphotransferase [Planctomycetota bacterium]